MAIALVTGSSSGFGLATAVTLARGGHTVIATMRNVDGAGELRKIVSSESLPLTVTALDVDDDASVCNAVNKVLAENGRIDVLVNNAGGEWRTIGGRGADGGLPPSHGALRCIKAVLPTMRENHRGCIVNVTSVFGRIALASQAPYAASNWAFEALSECLAQEMKAFNVRVAIIEPGIIRRTGDFPRPSRCRVRRSS